MIVEGAGARRCRGSPARAGWPSGSSRCRSVAATVAFYRRLGFEGGAHASDERYAILCRGPVELHFFTHEDLVPAESFAGCYLRVVDVDGMNRAFAAARLLRVGIPRMDALEDKPWGLREFAVVDPDGNFLRIGQVMDDEPLPAVTIACLDPLNMLRFGLRSSAWCPDPAAWATRAGHRAGSPAPSREAGGDTRMRIAVFGATGGVGIELVGQALERGHAVTAFVRDPASLARGWDGLTMVDSSGRRNGCLA